MEIAGIALGTIGILMGILNWKLFVSREIKGEGASAVPIVAVAFFLIAGVLSDNSLFNSYFWVILIVDGAAIPMFTYFAFKACYGKLRGS
jgi:hypothetical protein